MNEVTQEQSEMTVPMTLDQILMDLKGFGVEDIQEPVVIKASGKSVTLTLSNIPTEEELATLLSTEEYKGHAWVARIKVEILSRSISSLNGTDLRGKGSEIVTDPSSGAETSLQIALRNMIMGWGQEVVNVLWKILMVHCQRLEDRLFESLPDAQVMTDIEKRFIAQAVQELEEAQQEVYRDAARKLIVGDEES